MFSKKNIIINKNNKYFEIFSIYKKYIFNLHISYYKNYLNKYFIYITLIKKIKNNFIVLHINIKYYINIKIILSNIINII